MERDNEGEGGRERKKERERVREKRRGVGRRGERVSWRFGVD